MNTELRTLIDLAVDHSMKLDAAHRGVEAARARIEEAKLGLETAKAGVTTVREEHDALISQAEALGLSRAKFKDAVERMKSVLVDVGAIAPDTRTVVTPETTVLEPKVRAPRKKRGASEDGVPGETPEQTTVTDGTENSETPETAVDGGAAGAVEAPEQIATEEKPATETVLDLEAVKTEAEATIVLDAAADIAAEEKLIADENIERAAEEDAETDAEEAAISEAEEPIAEEEFDNSVACSELIELIDDITDEGEVRDILHSVVAVLETYSTKVAKTVVSVHPSPLTMELLMAVEEHPNYFRAEDNARIASIDGEKMLELLDWFAVSIDLLADGKADAVTAFSLVDAVPQAEEEKRFSAPETTYETVEAISDMELFSDASEEDAEPETVAETVKEPEPIKEPVTAPAVAPLDLPKAPPVTVSRPKWLKS